MKRLSPVRSLLPATLLAAALLATPGFSEGAMSDAERAAFRAEVRAYLLENPEVLVEAMNELDKRQQAADADRDKQLLVQNGDAIFRDAASWVGGNPDGDVTVVEFIDYRCGYCRKAYAEVNELVASDGNIRLIYKEYPILGEQSVLASRFAVAVLQVAGPEAYAKTHDALYSFRGDITPESLPGLATSLGLDPAPIMARMDAPEVTAVIEANHTLGNTLQINGTPTFVIDGTFVRGYVPLDGMQQIVAEQRAG